MPSNTREAFVITTRITGKNGESSRSQLWNTRAPLPLGHPFRWVMEKTENGIRIRPLSHSAKIHEIQDANIGESIKIQLPQQFSLEIKPVKDLKIGFQNYDAENAQALSIYHCLGNWVASSHAFSSGETYRATIGAVTVFEIALAGGQYLIKALAEAINASGKVIDKGQTLSLSAIDLSSVILKLANEPSSQQSWRFAAVKTPEFTDTAHGVQSEDAIWFKKSLRYAAVALGAFALMTYLWPKPNAETEPLVPPQFTKIVMTMQPKAAASAPAMTQTAVSKDLPKKVENSAVVQAFRAKALQSAVSGLLKGGMTKLLAESDFVAGTAHSKDARKIFDSSSVALTATGAATGVSNDKNVKVASIGGEGAKGATGYASGEHAGVNGQGHSFVSMDVADSTVEEGLTKDEVGEVIHRHMSEVRYCYESAMIRQPDIEGKLMIDFVIGASGAVKSSEVKKSTLPDPRLDDCILRRLVTWKFPQTKGGVDVAVSYPFIFKTLGR